jgi:hypothetical protein
MGRIGLIGLFFASMAVPVFAQEAPKPPKGATEGLKPVIGALPRAEAAQMLAAAEIQEEPSSQFKTLEHAKSKSKATSGDQTQEFAYKNLSSGEVWRYTTHAFGFIPAGESTGTQAVPIQHAGQITPDVSLKGAPVKVTLDRLRVAEYPGRGAHLVLFDFYAQSKNREDIRFNQTYRIGQGQTAAIIGFPIFIGLEVGDEGVQFRCYTVNVKNESDAKLLDFMQGDVFKNGLKLVNQINPVIPVVTGFAKGITEAILSRNNNIPVQQFFMGLDFSNIQSRAKLAQGSYVVVQVPSDDWDWSKWEYHPDTGRITTKTPPIHDIPYNYVIFSVSKQ